MNRHFLKKSLKNPNRNRHLFPNSQDIWKLPPYVVANFCGELAGVMLQAAQEYIYHRSNQEIRDAFQRVLHEKRT